MSVVKAVENTPEVVEVEKSKSKRGARGPHAPIPVNAFVRVFDADGLPVESARIEIVESMKITNRPTLHAYTKLARERMSDPTLIELEVTPTAIKVVG